ncbi:MAG: aldo/keto reductase [Kofleriaceae bacterium]|nr:aldo/keto reductase [Kofleriaceae bacterium]
MSLGTSGLRVSSSCLGTMTFGQPGWGCDPETAHAILARYIARGGNFIDTANNYSRGWAERIVGDYLAATPRIRERLVIATKFVSTLFPGDPNAGGAGRKAIVAQLEGSLRRLRCDYLDLYWMHAWDALTPIDETMRALDDLVAAGKVRYVGFSDTPAWKVVQAHTRATLRDRIAPIAIQIEYSLLQRTCERELIPAARELGLGVVAWSPLGNGILAGRYDRAAKGSHAPARGFISPALARDSTYDVVEQTAAIAREVGATPAAVALAWLRTRRVATILGVRTVAQLDANLDAEQLELAAAHVEALEAATRPSLGFPGELLAMIPRVAYGGSTIDGIAYEPTPYAATDDDRA